MQAHIDLLPRERRIDAGAIEFASTGAKIDARVIEHASAGTVAVEDLATNVQIGEVERWRLAG